MKTFAILSATAILTGCAGVTLPADPSKMSPQQLSAMARDKNANVSCAVAAGPWGKGSAVFVVMDQAPKFSGTVVVDSECKTTITLQAEPTKP